MSEAEKKIYHFNSNIRSNTGSRSSMTNNEERYLRALEIQEHKRALPEPFEPLSQFLALVVSVSQPTCQQNH